MKTLRSLLLAGSVLGAACGAEPSGPLGPVRLSLLSAPAAMVASGSPLAPGPVVQLLDANGEPAARRGVLITVSIGSGTGTLSGTIEVRTDDQGTASFGDLTIAATPGAVTLRFTAPGLSAAVSGSIAVVPGAAATLEIAAGSGQVAAAGTAVTTAPRFRVRDATGNGVPGVALAVTVAGGGTVAETAPVTGSDGTASVGSWTLGTAPGLNELTVSLPSGPAASLTALGVVGPAAKLEVLEGDGQNAIAGQPVPTAPAVKVTDAFGNPIAGVTVTFSVAAGGGTIVGAQPRSDADGVARVTAWRLGPDPGPNTLTASRTGVPSATVGAVADPVPVAILAGNNQQAFVSAELRVPVVVRLTNGLGVPRIGVTVTFTVTGGGGSFSTASAPTDSSGVVQVLWTVGSAAGTNTATVTADGAAPSTLTAEALRFRLVAAGRFHACGLTEAGVAWCWGDNQFGQIGDSTFVDRPTPVRVVGGLVFDSLVTATNGHFTCGITPDRTSWCWGSNRHGQTGNGTNLGAGGPFGNAQRAPVQVIGGQEFVVLSAGGDHACGIDAGGTTYCWGRGFNGELGDGSNVDRLLPTLVLGGFTFQAIGTGDGHTCGLAAGVPYCWGRAEGNGLNSGNNTPAPLSGGLQFVEVVGSAFSSCGRTAAGVVYCWGDNSSGQLGDGTLQRHLAPAPVSGGITFAQVAAGGANKCARTASGVAYCWGANDSGQTGTGSIGTVTTTPTLVAGGRLFSRVSVGQATSCGLEMGTGAVYCWGTNNNGQVGDGTLISRAEPTLVRF